MARSNAENLKRVHQPPLAPRQTRLLLSSFVIITTDERQLVWFEFLIGAPEDLRAESIDNSIHILIARPAGVRRRRSYRIRSIKAVNRKW